MKSRRKLTDEQERQIRRLAQKPGARAKDLAEQFHISQNTLYKICAGPIAKRGIEGAYGW